MVLLAAVVLSLGSCRIKKLPEQGELSKRMVEVKPFQTISMTGGIDVEFVQGDSLSISVEAPEELQPQIKVTSDGQQLSIIRETGNQVKHLVYVTGNSIGTLPVTVYVSSPRLDGVTILGSGDFECTSTLTTDHLGVTITGSGDAEFGRVNCKTAELTVIGSGDVEIDNLTADLLEANISGSGDIEVAGDIKSIKQNVVGSGRVQVGATPKKD